MTKIRKQSGSKAIFALAAGQSVLPLLLCIVALIAIQGWLFCTQMPYYLESARPLEQLIANNLKLPFAILLVILWLGITAVHTSGKSNIEYTMKRLGLSQNRMAFVFFINMLLCLVIFWVVEMMMLVGLSQLFLNQFPAELQNPQTLFLTTYRSDFFHKILPLHDWLEWLQIGIGLIALSLGSVHCVVARWNGKHEGKFAGAFCVIFANQISLTYFSVGLIFSCIAIFAFMRMIWEAQKDENE